jgi:hypothetical protein
VEIADGEYDKWIGKLDPGGVALAAIQGLNPRVEEKDARMKELEQRLEMLEHQTNNNRGGK